MDFKWKNFSIIIRNSPLKTKNRFSLVIMDFVDFFSRIIDLNGLKMNYVAYICHDNRQHFSQQKSIIIDFYP